MWEIVLLCVFLLGHAECTFNVELVAPRYVLQGQSAEMRCEYSVPMDQLHKVEWLHAGRKLFQFIKGRTPPFRDYPVHGAVIDRNQSDEYKLLLRDLRFEASGLYSCEVSTQAPIFTKRSDERELAVIQPQSGGPQVWSSNVLYETGEVLMANCSSSPARPAPNIAWLVNGLKVHSGRHNLSQESDGPEMSSLLRATSRFSLKLTDRHTGQLSITCLSTAPGIVDHEHQLTATLTVEVVQPARSSAVLRVSSFCSDLIIAVLSLSTALQFLFLGSPLPSLGVSSYVEPR